MAETVEPYAATRNPAGPGAGTIRRARRRSHRRLRRDAQRADKLAHVASPVGHRGQRARRLGHRCVPRGASAQLTVVCVRPDASGAIRLAPRSMGGDPDIDRSFDPISRPQEAEQLESLAQRLEQERPAPRALFRGELRRRLLETAERQPGGQSGCASGSPPAACSGTALLAIGRSGSRAPARSRRVESVPTLVSSSGSDPPVPARRVAAKRAREDLLDVERQTRKLGDLRAHEVTPKRSASTSRSRRPSSSSPAARSGEMPSPGCSSSS